METDSRDTVFPAQLSNLVCGDDAKDVHPADILGDRVTYVHPITDTPNPFGAYLLEHVHQPPSVQRLIMRHYACTRSAPFSEGRFVMKS